MLYYNTRGEKTEPRFDLNEDDFFAQGEEYAYLFDPYDNVWTCYDLHGISPQEVDIPVEHPQELNVN